MTKYNIASLQSNRAAQKSAFGFDDLLAILLLVQSIIGLGVIYGA